MPQVGKNALNYYHCASNIPSEPGASGADAPALGINGNLPRNEIMDAIENLEKIKAKYGT